MQQNNHEVYQCHTHGYLLITAMIIIVNIAFSSSTYAIDNSSVKYRVGVVPQFHPEKIEQIWIPLLFEVSKLSGVTLEYIAATNIPEFEKQFENGKFHFAYMNPYHVIEANRSQQYQPFARDIGKQLMGIIVVRKDSPITDIRQLDGKKIVMPAPNSLGAALLPRAEFANIHKIKPTIDYVKSHDSVYLNVLLGLADAGGGVMSSFNKQSKQVRQNLRIMYKTQTVPAHPIVVHPAVPSEVAKRVQEAFLALGKSKKGKALLAKIPMNQIGTTKLNEYDALRKLGLENFYIKNSAM